MKAKSNQSMKLYRFKLYSFIKLNFKVPHLDPYVQPRVPFLWKSL